MAWGERVSADAGRVLGALHAATATAGLALLHGDAWSRNVLAGNGRVTGLVDWEASHRGEPARKIARFLASSAGRAIFVDHGFLPPRTAATR